MSLRVITAPTVEPVTLANTKSYLRVDSTDDDTLITSLIKAARLKGEELSRRAFITQTLEIGMDQWPECNQQQMPRPPLLTIVSVKYFDVDNTEHTWTDYVVDINSEPGVIIFNSYPEEALRYSGAITVRFTAGYGAADTAVPENIKTAIMALVAYWYESRASDVPSDLANPFISNRVEWFDAGPEDLDR